MLTSLVNTGHLMADATRSSSHHNHKVALQINSALCKLGNSLHHHTPLTGTAMVYSSHLPCVKVELALRTVCRQRAVKLLLVQQLPHSQAPPQLLTKLGRSLQTRLTELPNNDISAVGL